MKLLFERPPESVKVGNLYFKVDTDFRLWAAVQACCDQGRLDGHNMLRFIRRAFGSAAWGQDVHELTSAFVYFLTCGDDEKEPKSNTEGGKEKEHHNDLYDLEEDAGRIVAAFEREYGIDLTNDTLHWWRFRVLLDDLLSKDKFTDIVVFRGINPEQIKDKGERKYYAERKRFYRLHKDFEPANVEELNANMVNALIKAREAAEAAR